MKDQIAELDPIQEESEHTASNSVSNVGTKIGRLKDKLKKRFPDKFDEEKAIVRDLEAERKVLEQGNGKDTHTENSI